MAISFVKKTPTGNTPNGGGAGTSATAFGFGSNVASGNLIVVVLQRWGENAGTLAAATISDTGSNTWYKDAESINTRDGVTIWHCYANSAATMSITAAFGTDSAYWCISAYEFSGVATGLTAGASGASTGSGLSTSPSAGAINPDGNCLYIGGVEFDAAVTCTEASGWTLGHEDESWTYAAGATEYRITSGSQTASWTLGTSAKWAAAAVAFAEASATTYTVTYNGNSNTSGTAPTDSNSPYASGATVTTLTNSGSLARTGYVFNGWNTAADGSGTHYNTGATFNISGNTTLYAEWSPRYTVTYNGNSNTSGSVPTDSTQYSSGASVTVLGNTGNLARSGYTFEGWNTAANGTGTHYDADDTFNISANTTLYAEWEETPVGTIGDYTDVRAGSATIRMIIANNVTSRTFPTGADDAGSATLTRRFYIGETELTNAQAVAILQWAYDNSKFNTSNASAHNYLTSEICRYGGRSLIDLAATTNGDENYNVQIAYNAGTFSVRNSMGVYPVDNITWFGGVMLANWLTEMKDGNTDNLVYTGIPTDGSTWNSYSTTVVDFAKTGYRLPTSDEWEYAARYRGSDNTNVVAGYSNPYYTQGDSASGATADYNNATASAAVAVYGTSGLATVKSKTANALGLYDMTGNLWEWFEAYGTNSAYDAGSCWERAGDQYLGVGSRSSNTATDGEWDMGVRLAKTYTEILTDGNTVFPDFILSTELNGGML